MKKYNDVFEYFIDCYFNWSMDYADLSNLADQYLSREKELWLNNMRKRVKELYELKDPQNIKDLVWQYGQRNLTIEKAQNMIELLYSKFCT